MTKDEFRRLLHSGHGRAVNYARANDVSAWRDVIADMSLHSRAIDPIFEGTHSAYIYNFPEILPDATTYHQAIIDSLPDANDDLDTRHRFTLARFLAEDGSAAARTTMYAHYNPGPQQGEAIAVNFVALDGLKGFLFAAEKIGALLRGPQNTVDQGWLYFRGKEHCGEAELLAGLTDAASNNEDLAAYLKIATGPPRNRPRSTRYERINWGREATPEALLQAAQTLVETRDPELLAAFVSRPFPLDPAPSSQWRIIGTPSLPLQKSPTHGSATSPFSSSNQATPTATGPPISSSTTPNPATKSWPSVGISPNKTPKSAISRKSPSATPGPSSFSRPSTSYPRVLRTAPARSKTSLTATNFPPNGSTNASMTLTTPRAR
jgi:hypothetical protein